MGASRVIVPKGDHVSLPVVVGWRWCIPLLDKILRATGARASLKAVRDARDRARGRAGMLKVSQGYLQLAEANPSIIPDVATL